MARRRRRTDFIQPQVVRSPYERAGASTNTRNAGLGMNTRNAGLGMNTRNAGLGMNTRNAGQTNAVPGGSSFGSYRAMKDAGYVQRRDINGNIRWVDPKTGLQPDGSPLNPIRNAMPQPLDADQVQANMTRFNERYDGGRTYVAPKYSEGDDFLPGVGRASPGPSVQSEARSLFGQPQETTLTPPEMQEPGAPPDNQQGLTEDEKGGLFQGTAAQEEAKKNNQQGLTEDEKGGLFQGTAAQEEAKKNNQQGLTEVEKEDQAAVKGGEEDRFAMSRNFLKTDKVPDSIFGYPIASRREDYTPEDLAFFREHPEAGGYYDLGEGSPEDGTEEGAPVQADTPNRGKYPGAWNNPGNVQKGEVEYDGETGSVKGRMSEGTFLTFRTPQDGLNAMAQSIGQMVREKIPAGQFTIDNLVKVYAPEKDANDVDRYAKFVSKWTRIPRGQVLDLSNGTTMALLLDAMVRQDSGHPHADWFTGEERKAAIKKMNTPARLRAKLRAETGDGNKK